MSVYPVKVEAAAETVSAFGTVELAIGNLVQAVVPITSLVALAEVESEAIHLIRLPLSPALAGG